MRESRDDLDGIGGSFDLDIVKKKHRRPDGASTPHNTLAAIEREILEEIASQSGRYGDRLDALLGDMVTLRQTIEPALAQLRQAGMGDATACQGLNGRIVQYNQLRAQAQRVQHYLIIHREAMGFWNHDDVFRFYPIPAALTPLPPTHTLEPPKQP